MKNLIRKFRISASAARARFSKLYLILFALPLAVSSCYIEVDPAPMGYDGRPGNAYLSLEWEYEKPLYLDAGTSDIPYHFDWGRDYLTRPGYYELYYEGEFWDGYGMAWYAWEIEYEIWRNYGTEGGPGYNGYDGANSYLTIILSPYGPYTNRLNKSLDESKYKVLSETEDQIVVEQTEEEFSIKITYKKVPRRAS